MVDVKKTQRLVEGRTLSADCTGFNEGRKKHTHPEVFTAKAPTFKIPCQKKTASYLGYWYVLVCIGNFSGGKFPLFLHFSGVVFQDFGLQIRGALAAATNWCKGGLTAVT